MDMIEWHLAQEERARPDAAGTGAGAALPLVLWVVVILGASGAAAVEQLPFWLCVLVVASPSVLLILGLWLRDLIAGTPAAAAARQSRC
ncbi:MAG TPA: hypothetical protein VEZ20_08005 [Allosphingosinicella sp.]|nr:hypothetical protein [Allosphingosinicella sp.]